MDLSRTDPAIVYHSDHHLHSLSRTSPPRHKMDDLFMSDGRYPAHPQRASSFSSLAPPLSTPQSRRQSWSATSFLENAMSLDLTSAPPSPVTPAQLQALSKRRSESLAKGSSASAVALPELFLHVEANCNDHKRKAISSRSRNGRLVKILRQEFLEERTELVGSGWESVQVETSEE
ncbi:hypothetical protein JCM5350_007703 [Sporobolomyces pararoseus]